MSERGQISHAVYLFDMEQKVAAVMLCKEMEKYLEGILPGGSFRAVRMGDDHQVWVSASTLWTCRASAIHRATE